MWPQGLVDGLKELCLTAALLPFLALFIVFLLVYAGFSTLASWLADEDEF